MTWHKRQMPDGIIYVGRTTAAAGAWIEPTTSDPTCLASIMPQYPTIKMEIVHPQILYVLLPTQKQDGLIRSARQARGSWKETEERGTSVEIVRRMREDWK